MQSTQGTQYLNPQVAANALMVTAQTLRQYEKEGRIKGVVRTAGGQRRYPAEEIYKLRDSGLSFQNTIAGTEPTTNN